LRPATYASATEILNGSGSSKHPILISEPHIHSEIPSIHNPAAFPEKPAIINNKTLFTISLRYINFPASYHN
jgi:hypothetical protein